MTRASFASRAVQRDDRETSFFQGSEVTDPIADPAVPPRLQDDKTLPLIIYVLLIAGPVTGVSHVVAVILAYISRKDAPDWLASHYQFQIRTFWLSLLFWTIAAILTPVGVGVVLFVAVGLWIIVRAIAGLSNLLKGQPYPTPKNWML